MNFLIRWIVTAIAVGAAVWIVPGITTVGPNGTVGYYDADGTFHAANEPGVTPAGSAGSPGGSNAS